MENTNRPRVSKLEDWLDTGKTVGEILAAGVSVAIGILTICKCHRSLRVKFKSPDKYWSYKNEIELKRTRLMAKAVNDIADAVSRL